MTEQSGQHINVLKRNMFGNEDKRIEKALIAYIKDGMARGYSANFIKEFLVNRNYDENLIDNAIRRINTPVVFDYRLLILSALLIMLIPGLLFIYKNPEITGFATGINETTTTEETTSSSYATTIEFNINETSTTILVNETIPDLIEETTSIDFIVNETTTIEATTTIVDQLTIETTTIEVSTTRGIIIPELIGENVTFVNETIEVQSQSNFTAIPNTLNIQGRLTDLTGTIVTDSTYNLTFKIYDAYTSGSLLYTEIHDNTNVNDGIYNIIVGSITSLNLNFDKPYYLSLDVNSTGEMSPRINLTNVPYAYRSRYNLLNTSQEIFEAINNGTFFRNNTNLIPDTNVSYNIGANIKRWSAGFIQNIRANFIRAETNVTATEFFYANNTNIKTLFANTAGDDNITLDQWQRIARNGTLISNDTFRRELGNGTFVHNNTDELFNYSRINVAGNITIDSAGQGLALDTNERIFFGILRAYYNGTCIIIEGASSTLNVC